MAHVLGQRTISNRHTAVVLSRYPLQQGHFPVPFATLCPRRHRSLPPEVRLLHALVPVKRGGDGATGKSLEAAALALLSLEDDEDLECL